MIEIRQSDEFKDWLSNLRDSRARARIAERIRRLGLGNLGDARPVGDGVSELKIDYGPGYRVYFVKPGLEIVVLLCGGDKSSQTRDIRAAKFLAQEV